MIIIPIIHIQLKILYLRDWMIKDIMQEHLNPKYFYLVKQFIVCTIQYVKCNYEIFTYTEQEYLSLSLFSRETKND